MRNIFVSCLQICRSLCPSKPLPKPRVATLRTLYHPTSIPQAILDPAALLLFFPGPNSTTGEDVLELHLHGGPAVLKSVLSALPKCIPQDNSHDKATRSRSAILPAEPGEFTRRAFYNSRLSLPQIEALGDLLTAETAHQHALSVRSAASTANVLTEAYMTWHAQLTAARGELEALIDFSEDQQFEDSPARLLANVARQAAALRDQVEGYLSQAVKGELLRDGINLALVGAPNVGKSSLLNAVVRREAAIVSSRAGTTRDVVDVTVDVGGWMVVIGDTAGFRPHAAATAGEGVEGHAGGEVDEIEVEGMKRAKRRAAAADVVLLLASLEDAVVDGARRVQLRLEDSAIAVAKEALDGGKELVVVVNKIDKLGLQNTVVDAVVPSDIALQIEQRFPGLPIGRIVGISCTDERHKATIQRLLQLLMQIFSKMTDAGGEGGAAWSEAIGASSRQRVLVDECRRHLDDFLTGLGDGQGEEDADVVLKAEALRKAAGCIGRIMGRGDGASTVDEVLGVVFER
ncbi:hypothetical protein DRE_02384 [Drechslerella stenobrocha 248]|uniref:TrmE-type G domain-containing protein n=1 Tax=Drechslerella stenobrocha 248 TaxID=1043628 RepID=W7IGG2_9PEZI|nr:hypothetical protein DRE_02384 [Drechslerella stenobrocha 248]